MLVRTFMRLLQAATEPWRESESLGAYFKRMGAAKARYYGFCLGIIMAVMAVTIPALLILNTVT